MYFFIVWLRNKLFDWNILKSKKFDIPIISVGNITIGGTGKTPHIEHFIKEILPKKRVAVLSRGYKRKTSGFVLADENCTAQTIGDEPYQIYKKFPEILVAVDEKRVRGVEKLLALPNPPEVILLDDAFQHRYILPSTNILLINYNRPIFSDKILPYGHLREPISAIKRADKVIITKCPKNLSKEEKKYFIENVNRYRHCGLDPQSLDDNVIAGLTRNRLKKNDSDHHLNYENIFFSSFVYSTPKNIFTQKSMDTDIKRDFLVVTGVVDAGGMYDYLQNFAKNIHKMEFADHHYFTKRDIIKINQKLLTLPADSLIITTEKDRARLLDNPFITNELKEKIFYIEINVEIQNF